MYAENVGRHVYNHANVVKCVLSNKMDSKLMITNYIRHTNL